MTSEQSRPFYKLLVLSAIFGAVAALQFLLFALVLKYGTQAIWQGIAGKFGLSYGTASPFFILAFCIIGGLAVGIITKLTKVKPTLLVDDLQDVGETGGMDPRIGYVAMIRGLIGLLFGGSIGPEGPLTGGSGGLGTFIAEKLKFERPVKGAATLSAVSGMFGAFLGSPFVFPLFIIEGTGKVNWKAILPAFVAGSVGFGVYDIITQTVYGPIYQFPPYGGFHFVELLEAVLLGLIGGGLGILFIRFYRTLKTAARRWESRPIELAVIAGAILGTVGIFFPLVLFDGQNQVNVLLLHTAEYGAIFLIALALFKLFVTVVCLALGWNGGYIFPSYFIGASMGIAVHIIFPFIPETVCLACTMTSVAVVLIRSPIAITLLTLGLFGLHITPIVAVSATTAFIIGYGETLLLPHPGQPHLTKSQASPSTPGGSSPGQQAPPEAPSNSPPAPETPPAS